MIQEWTWPKPVFVVENDQGIPSGTGMSFAVADYGADNHILWGVTYDIGGAVWWVPNPLVRFQINRSLGRTLAPGED